MARPRDEVLAMLPKSQFVSYDLAKIMRAGHLPRSNSYIPIRTKIVEFNDSRQRLWKWNVSAFTGANMSDDRS